MILKELTVKSRKFIRSLHQKKYRDESGLYFLEGKKVCMEAFEQGIQFEMLVIKKNAEPDVFDFAESIAIQGVDVFICTEEHFIFIADAQSPQGILALIKKPNILKKIDKPFIALEGVSDPGNIGTIIRTADWFGFENIILDRNCADPFAPKVLRSTMGSIFRENIYQVDNISEYLFKNLLNFEFYGASLKGKSFLNETKPSKNFGVFFGNESKGLSQEIEKKLTHTFLIRGYGGAESLNVAVSAGIAINHFAGFSR